MLQHRTGSNNNFLKSNYFLQTFLFFHSLPDASSDEEYEDNFKDSKATVTPHGTTESNEEDDADDVAEESEAETDDEVLKSNMSWKDNLAEKAREAYLDRHSNTDNLMKLVYGVFSTVSRWHSFMFPRLNNTIFLPSQNSTAIQTEASNKRSVRWIGRG